MRVLRGRELFPLPEVRPANCLKDCGYLLTDVTHQVHFKTHVWI